MSPIGTQAESKFGPYENAFKIYEEGKHRRYALLFSVNGGAFAVAKLLQELKGTETVGQLSLTQLAYGLALFTIFMTADLFVFGERMRQAVGDNQQRPFVGIFSLWGKAVLILVSLLMAIGWCLVGAIPWWGEAVLILIILLIAIAWHLTSGTPAGDADGNRIGRSAVEGIAPTGPTKRARKPRPDVS